MRHRVGLAKPQYIVEGFDIHGQACELLLDAEQAQIAAHILEAILLVPQCTPDHGGHLREQCMHRLLRVHLQTQRNDIGHQPGGLPVACIDPASHRHGQHQVFCAGAAVVIRGNQRNQHLRQAGTVVLAQRPQLHHLLRGEFPGATQQPGGQLVARARQGRRRWQVGQLLHPVIAITLKAIRVAVLLLQLDQRQRAAVLGRYRLAPGGVGGIQHRHALHHDRSAIAVHHQMAHALHPHVMVFAQAEDCTPPQRPVLQILRLADLLFHPMLGRIPWRRIVAEVEIMDRRGVLGHHHLAGHAVVLDDA